MYGVGVVAKASPYVCVSVGFASVHVHGKERPIVPLPIFFKMGVNSYVFVIYVHGLHVCYAGTISDCEVFLIVC